MFCFAHCARALDYIMARGLGMSVTQYVDDFPQLEPKALASSGRKTTDKLFHLIGWTLKKKEP